MEDRFLPQQASPASEHRPRTGWLTWAHLEWGICKAPGVRRVEGTGDTGDTSAKGPDRSCSPRWPYSPPALTRYGNVTLPPSACFTAAYFLKVPPDTKSAAHASFRQPRLTKGGIIPR